MSMKVITFNSAICGFDSDTGVLNALPEPVMVTL